MNSHICPFLEFQGDWAYAQTKFDRSSSRSSIFERRVAAYLGGGVDIFLSENVALEGALNLGKDLKNGKTQFGLQLGLKFFLSGRDRD